jgi:DNA (cytosine-5)-methyltransferase 1
MLYERRGDGMNEIIIDSFAGGGGASTGIELALGRAVDVAINHDTNAIKMHETNHPFTRHYCENIFKVDPIKAVQNRPVALMWASPDCTHFSRAKGGKPVKKEIRGLAWVILKWASKVRPRVIILENVPEFVTWGKIDKSGRPIKERKGETFKQFTGHLENMGYAVDWRVLDASDFGAGTSRHRLYLIARCDGESIIFPNATHGDGLLPKRTAAEFIDFSVRGKSIFNRKKPLADATLNRIAKGLDKFTIKNPKPFISYIMSNNTNNQGTSTAAPLGTITTGNRHFVMSPHISKYFSGAHQKGSAVDTPLDTITAVDHNALATANLIRCNHSGGTRIENIEKPIATITVNAGGNEFALVEHHLCIFRRNMDCRGIDEPLPTATARAGHFAYIKTYFTKYSPDVPAGNWEQVRDLLNKYAGYSIAGDEILILEIDGTQYFISDIELRMLLPRELYGCQGFPRDYIINRTSDGKPLSQSEQIKKVGNSVCPPVASALVRANVAWLARTAPIETMQEFYKEVGK